MSLRDNEHHPRFEQRRCEWCNRSLAGGGYVKEIHAYLCVACEDEYRDRVAMAWLQVFGKGTDEGVI